ncbi:MAG: hypothetical protein EA353_12015 [Puniceicoccaceae bacterium]|nr:MAG: hypothetical protein EA353_12015 [Puniceicoccaceae bacterium]
MSMLADSGSYSVQDFIPFTDETYFRLFERQFEAWWPAHLLMLALGIALILLACRGKIRAVAVGLAIPVAACAITFHLQLYAELTPVGQFFGWALLLQVLLILAWGFVSKPGQAPLLKGHSLAGVAIAAFGLALYPALGLLADRGWKAVEYFGLAPDPTVCCLLGIALICARPVWLLLLLPIPLLWAATTAATLQSLEAPFALTLPIIGVITVAAAIWKAVAGHRT